MLWLPNSVHDAAVVAQRCPLTSSSPAIATAVHISFFKTLGLLPCPFYIPPIVSPARLHKRPSLPNSLWISVQGFTSQRPVLACSQDCQALPSFAQPPALPRIATGRPDCVPRDAPPRLTSTWLHHTRSFVPVRIALRPPLCRSLAPLLSVFVLRVPPSPFSRPLRPISAD